MNPSICIALEPAFQTSDYESKYLPLLKKYVDPSFFDVTVIGSHNAVGIFKKIVKVIYPVPITSKASNAFMFILKYSVYLLLLFFFLIHVCYKTKCAVLISLGGHPYSGFIVSLVAKFLNKKSIVRISEPTRIIVYDRFFIGRLMASLVAIAESISLSLSDLILTNRDMLWYNSRIGSKQVILSQGVDFSIFHKKVSAALNSDRYPILITVARLDKQKRIEQVIEAVHLLKTKYPKIFYYIIGSGPHEIELRNKVQLLDILNHICFYGYVSPEKVPFLLNSSDIFVLPSLIEGLPSAVLEAMSCGLPTVITSGQFNCGSSFSDEETVLIVSSSPTAIARGIDRLVSDTELRERLVTNAQKFVKANHDCSKSRKLFTGEIKKLIRSQKTSKKTSVGI